MPADSSIPKGIESQAEATLLKIEASRDESAA